MAKIKVKKIGILNSLAFCSDWEMRTQNEYKGEVSKKENEINYLK